MWQAFVIVLREGFEAFLIVAITLAYLRRTRQDGLASAVHWGIVISVAASALLGAVIFTTSANQPLWEGILGLVSAVLVGAFVVHMWKTAPHLKQDMEKKLAEKTAASSSIAWTGVFGFTVLMISREGMETALMLFQVHTPGVVLGSLLGALGAGTIALLWNRVGRHIDLKLFFQVTSVFLMLFVVQVLIYSFHEFTETGLIPNSEYWHVLTEPYGPDGRYGRWYSIFMIGACALWLLGAWAKEKISARRLTPSR